MTFTPDLVMEWADQLVDQPLMLAALLALATLLTEDGTLIAGSLLVGAGLISAPLAIAALAFGIAAGDVGLYGFGWLARESRFLRRRLPLRKARALRQWLRGKTTPVLFFSRFLPGTRLPTYLTFGFLRMGLVHFTWVMSVAALVWVTAMVLFVSQIQQAFSTFGSAAGIIAGIAFALLLIFLAQRVVRRTRYARKLQQAAANADTLSPRSEAVDAS